MHIENKDKNDWNISTIFNSNIFNSISNNGHIDFIKGENTYKKPKEEIVVFSRGRNTPVEKIKRMIDSLK